jgi:hypothetical protein
MLRSAKIISGAVLAVSVGLPAAAASAHLSALINGAANGYTFSYNLSDHGYKRAAVKDLGRKQWVKAEYYRSNSGKKRTLWNKSGKGTTATSASGATITKLKVCEEYDWSPDSCSPWAVKGGREHVVK